MNILQSFPDKDTLLKWQKSQQHNKIRKVNAHIHTPFSFSSFNNMNEIFSMCRDENISVLGINDFYTTDGYAEFYSLSLKNRVFPLFNIEFIGLLKEAQSNNIRINDPNNPGRIYFTGKGLKYPFSPEEQYRKILNEVIEESQVQVRAMIDKANKWFHHTNVKIELNYDRIKTAYAKELVRERHIAKAIRTAIFDTYSDTDVKIKAFGNLFDGKPLKSALTDIPALENEIRGNLLKAGGKVFVEENKKSFLGLDLLIKIIINAGGIPCYPVLLDDKNGNITEFEADFQKLCDELSAYNIACIELIPGRNDFVSLKNFVQFFDNKEFLILFGTEHNTPDIMPLTVTARGNTPLDDELTALSYENACVVAAHQYLVTKNAEGYINASGHVKISEKKAFTDLGKAVIEWYIRSEH